MGSGPADSSELHKPRGPDWFRPAHSLTVEIPSLVAGDKRVALLRAFAAPALYILVLKLAGRADTYPSGSAAAFFVLCGAIVLAGTAVALFARFTGLRVKVRAEQYEGAGWVFIFCVGCVSAAFIGLSTGVQIPTATIFRIILLSALIGIAEELTFRGVCLSSLHQVTGSVVALFASSAIFALAHFSNLWAGQTLATTRVQVISAMLGGLFFGWTYLKLDGGLWVVAIAHAMFDGTIFILAITQPSLFFVMFAIFPVGLAAVLWFWLRVAIRRARL